MVSEELPTLVSVAGLCIVVSWGGVLLLRSPV